MLIVKVCLFKAVTVKGRTHDFAKTVSLTQYYYYLILCIVNECA